MVEKHEIHDYEKLTWKYKKNSMLPGDLFQMGKDLILPKSLDIEIDEILK